MSDFVRFTKNGLKCFSYDSDLEDYKESSDEVDLTNLRSHCEIDSGITLGDIFKAVEANELLSCIISGYSLCFAIQEFHDEAKLPYNQEDKEGDNDPLEKIEIAVSASFYPNDENSKILDFEGLYFAFHGISKNKISYSLSFLPMNALANLPIEFNGNCRFTKENCDELLPVAKYKPSLLEILDAIYYEISFHGSPSETKKISDELVEMVKELNLENKK